MQVLRNQQRVCTAAETRLIEELLQVMESLTDSME